MSHLGSILPFQPILDRDVKDVLRTQFNKKFSFQSGPRPPPEGKIYTAPYWEDERLKNMKIRLNKCKSQLNEMPLDKWHQHTKRMNPAGTVAKRLKLEVKPELLTQAWAKFHEIFHVFNLGPAEKKLRTVYLCEAPGAFVTSLNHALVSNHPETDWDWLATTLNPHYEGNDLDYMINDDRFIIGTMDHWDFGDDNTGHLMHQENLAKLIERSAKLGEVYLVTADGSIDCQGDPGRQESIEADLHLSEVVAALNLLPANGNLVVKMFTTFESESVCLLYLLSVAFQQVTMFKPATSKEGNSEVYVIGQKMDKSDWLKQFLEDVKPFYGNFPEDKSLFDLVAIPADFLEEVRKASNLFLQLQENVIENNLYYYNKKVVGQDEKDLADVQRQVAEHYMDLYKMEEVPDYRFVVHRRREPTVTNLDPRFEVGTFNDKQMAGSLETEDADLILKLSKLNVKNAVVEAKYEGSDQLNMECEASNKNDPTSVTPKEGLTTGEASSITLVPIVFDASDMGKGYINLKLNNCTAMRKLKKLLAKHLDASEDTFMLYFNNREVGNQTPLQLFGNNLEADHNVIKIVKSIKIYLAGQLFLQENSKKCLYLDVRPNTQFWGLRQKIAAYLKEPPELLRLVYNNHEILDGQTPKSLKMEHGHLLQVIKKNKINIEKYITVKVLYSCLGQESLTLMSKIRPKMTMEEWKIQICEELGEPIQNLSFIWEDLNIGNLDTPEQIGIQNGDTVRVISNDIIEIHIKRDGQLLANYLIHIDHDFFTLAKLYSREFHVGVNSILFKFRERDVNIWSDTANKLGLMEGGIIEVFHQSQENVMTVEFYVENSSLLSNFPRLNEFPLLWDAHTEDQAFLLKDVFEELFVHGFGPSLIMFLHNAKEIKNGETLKEVGVSKNDRICIDVREHNKDDKEVTVYVRRNLKQTKSNMGHGQLQNGDEICAFKLDSSKPLSEFIKKVKSRIACNSKEEKLFLGFNHAMVNKDDFWKNLKLAPFNNSFTCYTFPNLVAFKKHLETSLSKDVSFYDSDESFDSFSNRDLDFPTLIPNSNTNSSDQISDEKTKDFKKKAKGIQMNIDEKKKEKNGCMNLAKDIKNHRDFENVDDILKFIEEEDLPSNTSKENKNVGTSKRKKGKNKKRIKTATTNEESDKLKVQDFKKDEFVVEVSRNQDILKFIGEEDSPVKTTEGNRVKVGSLQMKKQNTNINETNRKESDKKVETVTDTTMDDLQNVRNCKGNFIGDKQSEMKDVKKERKNESNKLKDIVCNICTVINHDGIFCDVCGNDLMIDGQNWQQVGIKNKRKLANKTQSKEKSTFSVPEKLLQTSELKTTSFSNLKKLLQESDLKKSEEYSEEHVSKSIHPKQQVSTFRREHQKQSKDTSDADHTKSKQVKVKTEIFLESEFEIEFPKIEETYFTNKFTRKGNESRKHSNNTKMWTASEKYDYRRSVTEIVDKTTEQNKNNEPENQPALFSKTQTKLVDSPFFDCSTKTSMPPPILPPPSSIPLSSHPSVPDRSTKAIYESQGSVAITGLKTVTVPTTVVREFLSISASNTAKNVETCGILGGKFAKNSFIISHLVIPKQSGTANTCSMEREEELWKYQDKEGLMTLGWIHTHPTQTAFLSSVDMHCQYGYQVLLPEALAIVCSPKYGETGYFSLTRDHGLNEIRRCTRVGFHPHPKEPPLFEEGSHFELNSSMTIIVKDLRF